MRRFQMHNSNIEHLFSCIRLPLLRGVKRGTFLKLDGM
ncbi:hypothetical protein P3T17_004456 [Paraburkholderia sp. GAS82]